MKKSKGEISVDKLKVLIFVGDVAQENLIKALFVRVARESGLDLSRLEVQSPYSRGGGSIMALKDYINDYGMETAADCFVLGSDGNCNGFVEKRKMLEKNLKKSNALDRTILAIPDPHIERWYLIDSSALSYAVGCPVGNYSPKQKCDKGHYKNLLREAIQSVGVEPLQGGAEYGSEVGTNIDIFKASREDSGFKFFIQQVKDWASRKSMPQP
jgi:hypothetical protein